MEEAILMKDLLALKGQDRLKDEVKDLIDKEHLKTVVVTKYVKT